MSNLFHKAAVFTDIHFGKRSDSEQHNQDCLEYVYWFCKQVVENEVDTIIFMGDWFDNRSRLRVDTIDYSWQAIHALLSLKRPIYWLIGNHDLYFRNHRDVDSLPYLSTVGINTIRKPQIIGDVLLCPWLIGSEFADVPSHESQYVFGHFELPLFMMNENTAAPDNGGLHADHFITTNAVFSGHFHRRQLKVNANNIPVWYIGNCFAHDFNDINDRKRGCMLLEWGGEPEFLDWMDGPSYHRTTLSELTEIYQNEQMDQFGARAVIECYDDVGLEIEEITEVRSVLGESVRELRIRPRNVKVDVTQETDIGDDAKTVDQMVVEHLRKLDTEGSDFDAELMVQIYESVGND